MRASFSEASRCFFHVSFFGDSRNIYNHYIFTISDKLLTRRLKYSQDEKIIHKTDQRTTFSAEVIHKTDKLLTKRNKPLTKSRLRFLMAVFLKIN